MVLKMGLYIWRLVQLWTKTSCLYKAFAWSRRFERISPVTRYTSLNCTPSKTNIFTTIIMLAKYAALLVASAAPLALAATPVESGTWIPDTYSFSAQQCEGGEVDGDNFYIPVDTNGDNSGSGCSNGHLRAERRYKSDYTDGVRQFSGTFTINEMSGTRISIKQTFGDSPYFILGVDNTGRLYSVEGGVTIAEGVANVGDSVTIHTVHNAGNHNYRVYVNGQQSYSVTDAPSGTFYDKIGAYTTDSGSGDLNITWTDVAFWHRQD